MDILPLDDGHVLPNEMKVEPAYLERARNSGRYFPLVAVEDGRVWGFAEGTIQFHPTRGEILRIRSVYGPDKALRPFLAMFRQYAARLNLAAVYVSSTPHNPQLCTAARSMKFERIEGDVGMRRKDAKIQPTVVPDVIVRSMPAGEYLGIRRTFLGFVSKGPYVSNEFEVRLHVDSRLFFPMVATVDGQIAAYAELALIHAGPASCPVGRIERVVVDVPHRGRNISRSLVGELVRKAVVLGCAHVDLQVAKDNVPATKTYEALGFVRTDEILYWLDMRSSG